MAQAQPGLATRRIQIDAGPVGRRRFLDAAQILAGDGETELNGRLLWRAFEGCAPGIDGAAGVAKIIARPRQIVQHACILGQQPRGGLEMRQRLGNAALTGQQRTQIAPGLGPFGPQRDRFLHQCDAQIEVAQPLGDHAAEMPGLRVGRFGAPQFGA